jgi:hypothetical protein
MYWHGISVFIHNQGMKTAARLLLMPARLLLMPARLLLTPASLLLTPASLLLAPAALNFGAQTTAGKTGMIRWSRGGGADRALPDAEYSMHDS